MISQEEYKIKKKFIPLSYKNISIYCPNKDIYETPYEIIKRMQDEENKRNFCIKYNQEIYEYIEC